jgi:hypothetical protein
MTTNTAKATYAQRRGLKKPVEDIELVTSLLEDHTAGLVSTKQPGLILGRIPGGMPLGTDEEHTPRLTTVNELDAPSVTRIVAPLKTELKNLPGLLSRRSRRKHLAALIGIMRHGLLTIDVLAGCKGRKCLGSVQVNGRGNENSVDIPLIEQLPVIREPARPHLGGVLREVRRQVPLSDDIGKLERLLQVTRVHIAKADHAHAGRTDPQEGAKEVPSPVSQADKAYPNLR